MSPEQIRETLLQSARKAGERYIHVRGVDLEAALTGTTSVPVEPSKPSPKTAADKKDR